MATPRLRQYTGIMACLVKAAIFSAISSASGLQTCCGTQITNRCSLAVAAVQAAQRYFVVKKSRRFKFDEVRQQFRLTSTEKRVAVFVVAAFALGLITKCYRDAHPSPAPIQTHSGKSPVSRSSSTNVDQPGALNVRETARGTRRSAEKLNLPDSPAEQQYQRK